MRLTRICSCRHRELGLPGIPRGNQKLAAARPLVCITYQTLNVCSSMYVCMYNVTNKQPNTDRQSAYIQIFFCLDIRQIIRDEPFCVE
jgi:hypothetical protein